MAISQNLQSPEDFLPTSYGKYFTPHHLLVDYFEYVAANTPNMKLQQYGRTNEQRPLLWAIISSPENMQNLETIRTDNLKKAGLLPGKPSSDNPTAIVWLSYGVHGNEAGASESSLSVLYALARPDSKMKEYLKNTIVIIDPCINPDGYSRYTHWNWSTKNKNPDPSPDAREHNEPWPGGRVNHYLFDLNRDWAWQTQVESQQRLEIYQQWMPHVHVDYHEMGHNSPYYFAPAAQPYHRYITDWQGDFQLEIGKNHAGHFDSQGWLYYTREIFDLFYPSYGDTYPIFNGAIGMTHEQAGHGRSGCAIQMSNGDTLTIRDRIDHHYTTSISNIEISSKRATQLVNEFSDYFKRSSENPPGQYKTFILPAANNADRIARLCRFLDKHQIQYGAAGKSGASVKAYHYADGQEKSIKVGAKDILISAYQPKAILTQVLFEPQPFLVDSLTYDITAWALPHAYGLDCYASTQKMSVNLGNKPASNYQASNPSKAPYAYLGTWQSLDDTRFLGSLLQKNIKVRYSTYPFELDGKSYAAGTLVISRADNRKNPHFDQTVSSLAQKHQRNLSIVSTGLSSSGYDLGSDKMQLIEKPKIAVLQNDKVSSYNFGQIWYSFEEVLDYPLTVINSLRQLDKYNLLILPEGYYSVKMDALKEWISGGGRVIAIGSALRTFRDKEGFNLVSYATDGDKSAAKKAREKKIMEDRRNHYGERERAYIADYIPGAIIKLKMDTTHPLAFGMSDYYFSLKTNSSNYPLLKNSWNVGYTSADPLTLGFIGSNVRKKIGNTSVFAVQQMGGGSVIYMVDNPLFRGFWRQGHFLFGNAVFFAGQ